jgi:serine/threonine-protein kinase
MVGQQIGKYRVTDQIGRGGMGTVFRARDETLHRDVAIKILNTELNDPSVARRFRAEAVTVARLNHPGIAIIYELLEHEGQWLMIMEYVRGETLEHLVSRQGPLRIEQATDLCTQTLSALAHAHALGVVHRDLKPANLMVNEAGAVKIMDFGISRVAGTEHLTSAGFMLGTPAYMAPEQVLGHDIDARTDIYAAGVVLYHLTTGLLPFKGATPLAMAQSRINDTPTPIRSIRSDVPVWLGRVLERALAREPAARFQTAAAFKDALRRGAANLPIETDETVSTPPELIATAAPRSLPLLNQVPAGVADTPTMPSRIEEHETAPVPVSAAAAAAVLDPPPAAGAAGLSGVSSPTSTPQEPWTDVSTRTGGRRSATMPALMTGAVALLGLASLLVWRPWSPVASPSPERISEGSGTQAAALPQPGRSVAAAPSAGGALAKPSTSADMAAAPPTVAPPTNSSTPLTSAPADSPAAAPVSAARSDPAAGSTAARTGRAGTVAAPSGAHNARGRSGAAIETTVAFDGIRLLVVTGTKAQEQDAALRFDRGAVTVLRAGGGPPLGSIPYTEINSAAYTRAKHPKWWPTLAGPPATVDLPGGLFAGDRHWLALQSRGAYLILRLNDRDFRQVLEAVAERTGRPVGRIP